MFDTLPANHVPHVIAPNGWCNFLIQRGTYLYFFLLFSIHIYFLGEKFIIGVTLKMARETYIKEPVFCVTGGITMAKVLIATLYAPEPVLVAANKLGPDRLILFIDNEPSKEQEKGLAVIK